VLVSRGWETVPFFFMEDTMGCKKGKKGDKDDKGGKKGK
jgi:hypothetical protein